MRDVYVIGAGMTRFGVHMDRDVRSLCEEALYKAMTDAGVLPKDVETGYLGTVGLAAEVPMMAGQIAFEQVGVTGIPITRVENACGSGSNAIREAWIAVRSGLYDVAIAAGVEIMNQPTRDQVPSFSGRGGGAALMEGTMGFFPPGIFAMLAQKYIEEGWLTRDTLAAISVKNAFNGSRNPLAHLQRILTREQVLQARMISYPLTMLDCCPMTDGAAAVVLCSESALSRFKGKPVLIKAMVQKSGTYAEEDPEMLPDTTVRAAEEVFAMSGVKPQDIDFVECHDCFTMAEVGNVHDLGYCDREDVGRFILEGNTEHTGPVPFNLSGGLMSKGHPLGATGPAQIYELVQQLRGDAGPRQIQGARLGLQHNGGGFRHGDTGIVVCSILEKVT